MNIKENEAILEVEELAIAKRGLLSRIDRWTPACGTHRTAIGALSFVRWERPLEPGVTSRSRASPRSYRGRNDISRQRTIAMTRIIFLITPWMSLLGPDLDSKEQPYLSLMLKLTRRQFRSFWWIGDFSSAKQSQSSKSG